MSRNRALLVLCAVAVAALTGVAASWAFDGQPRPLLQGRIEEFYWFVSDEKVSGYTQHSEGYFSATGVSAITHYTDADAHVDVYADWVVVETAHQRRVIPRDRVARLLLDDRQKGESNR